MIQSLAVSTWLVTPHATAVLLVVIVGTLGCSGGDDSVERAKVNASRSSGIINGTPVDPNLSGHVAIFGGGAECSGELISNSWFVSAAHCIGPLGVGSTVQMGTQSASVTSYVLHPTLDVAMVQFAPPFTMNTNGTTNGYWKRIVKQAGIPNEIFVPCYSYGQTVIGGSGGVLTAASLYALYQSNSTVLLQPNGLGQIQSNGDSGGACFYFDLTNPSTYCYSGCITGVTSSVFCEAPGPGAECTSVPVYATQTAGNSFVAWAYNYAAQFPVGQAAIYSTGSVMGYAYDPDLGATPINVNIIIDNNGVSALANLPNGDYPGHGFSYEIPATYLDGKTHTLLVDAYDDQDELAAGVIFLDTTFSQSAIGDYPTPVPFIWPELQLVLL